MASVGISIPPPEPGTSPVSSTKVQQYESYARRNSSAAGTADRAAAAGARLARKRSCSFHSEWRGVKRRRQGIVPPTKFLLGGNICDPLNLGSLNDEEANRIANANTPVSSPVPTPKHRKEPIEVIIPTDISDPLGLNGPEEALLSPGAQRRKRGRKKKKHPSGHALDRSVSVFEPAARGPGLHETAPSRSVSEGGERSPPPTPTAAVAAAAVVTEPATPEVPPTPQLEFQPCRPASPLRDEPPAPVPPAIQPAASSGKSPVAASTPAPVRPEKSAGPQPAPATAPAAAVTPPASAAAATPAPGRGSRPHSRKTSAEIVSPALPQPGARPLFPRPPARGAADGQAPVFRTKDAAFQYGNYNRYYGYRNPIQLDSRLGWLKREWFAGLDVLDVGCNVGHVTLTVARDHQPRRCVGIDIDSSLIKAARRNVKHYQRVGEFPSSLPMLFGDLVPSHAAPGTQFPRNVSFVHGNYVLDSDAMLEAVKPEFDTILCLSITKWVHLNYGDAGLRRFFRRAFLSLRPGGRLLLEPQPWASYVKKKKLTPRIWENFQGLRLRPDTFPDLLINEIGFERYKAIGRPHHSAKGFSRQLQMFMKAAAPSAVGSSATPEAAPQAATDAAAVDTRPGRGSDSGGSAGQSAPTQSTNISTSETGPCSGEGVNSVESPAGHGRQERAQRPTELWAVGGGDGQQPCVAMETEEAHSPP